MLKEIKKSDYLSFQNYLNSRESETQQDILLQVEKIIKEVREKKGFSQEELSKKSGVSRTTISELENQKTEVITNNPLAESYNATYGKVKIKNQTSYNLTEEMMKPDIEIENKNIIIIDDIYTTGSTIEACAKVLYDAGVKEVYFISLCIGQGF